MKADKNIIENSKNKMKGVVFFILTFLSFFVCTLIWCEFNSKEQSLTVSAVEEINPEVKNTGYTSATFNQYQKGMTEVNLMFNFINYSNDYVNHFTATEIQTIMTNVDKDLNDYFSVMSQDFVEINSDYCCYVSSFSYNYYLSKSDDGFSMELTLFNNAVGNRLDYDGTQKLYAFDEYNVMINCFAGDSGEWSSFLWPHAYPGKSLIMMTEYKQGYEMESSTLCHEMLHVFGVMDLYAYKGDSQWFTAQYFDMMGASYKNFSTNAYFRNKIGWIDSSEYGDATITPIEEIPNTQKGSLTLNLYPRATEDFSKTIAYKFGENEENDEYFVAEYRIRSYGTKRFDSLKPATSVIIYRVNPNASEYGNERGNNVENYVNEVIYMGDSTIDISTDEYTESCTITEGETHGNRGVANSTSLVYSSGGGRANLFNGENSGIAVYVESLTNECARIRITFAEDEPIVDGQKEKLDLSEVEWGFTQIVYNGQNRSVALINLPSAITVNYSGTIKAINVGNYVAVATLVYDTEKYEIINQNFSLTHSWHITPALITVRAEDKTSKYGENIKSLTFVTYGTIYNADNLNIKLEKQSGINKGTYIIYCSASNSNYQITTINGIYTIEAAEITIKADNKTSKYGENLQELTYAITSGEIYNNDNLNIVLNKQAGTNKGTYIIYCSASNSNYQITTINGNYTITPRILKIKVDNQSYFLEDFDDYNKTGFVILSGSDSLLDEVLIEVQAIDFNKNVAGFYELTAVVNNSNYELVVEKGQMSIIRKEVVPEPVFTETDVEDISENEKIILICAIGGTVLSVSLIGISFKIRKQRRKKLETAFFESEMKRFNNDKDRRRW